MAGREEAFSRSVIASAAKQSRIFPPRDSGLVRCARNDDVETFRRILPFRFAENMRGNRARVSSRALAALSRMRHDCGNSNNQAAIRDRRSREVFFNEAYFVGH